MINGVVKSNAATVRVRVKGSAGTREILAIIDTGFTSLLTLPSSTITELGLRWQTVDRAMLADGSVLLVPVYEATIRWDGVDRPILVHQSDVNPLIGMKLLRGYELRIQAFSGGRVTIKRLKGRRK